MSPLTYSIIEVVKKMQIVDGKNYLSEVKNLIIEYSQRLGRDLSFQNINDELRDPAHKYTAPEGEILVVEKLIRFGTAL